MSGKILSFNQLQKGLDLLKGLGRIETEVIIYDMRFVLRTLTPDEHKSINSYAKAYMEQYEEDDSSFSLDITVEFFTVRKIEALAYSIVVMGDLDLRDIEYVERGDTDGHGNTLKEEKHVFLREFLVGMDSAVIDILHRKYSDLLEESEEKAAAKVKFRHAEEELAKVEARRRELREELGLPEFDAGPDSENKDTQGHVDSDTMEALREQVFSPVEAEGSPEATALQPEALDEMDLNNGKFVRIDDPERPYSEEEQQYFAEQEMLFQQRFHAQRQGGTNEPQGSAPQENDAAAKLQKHRRQPLNLDAPQIETGALPSQTRMHRAPAVRRGHEEVTDGELAPGPLETDATLNSPPLGGVNPNFKGK